MTNDTDRVTPEVVQEHERASGRADDGAAGEGKGSPKGEGSPSGTLAYDPRGLAKEVPIPIRTPARVMRIWFAPYEDTAGDLHMPGIVLTEIHPRRWNIGEKAPTVDNVPFVPIGMTNDESAQVNESRPTQGLRNSRDFTPLSGGN